MKKKWSKLILFIIFKTSIFTYELGENKIEVHSVSLVSQSRFEIYSVAPAYIWRKYGENIIGAKLPRYPVVQGTIPGTRRHLGIRGEFLVSDSRIEYTLMNLVSEAIEGSPTIGNLDLTGKKSYHIRYIKNANEEDSRYGFKMWAETELNIPWEVPDGQYNFRGKMINFYYGAGDQSGRTGAEIPFNIVTYLDVDVENIDFGKVIFTRNAPEITKSVRVNITGGSSKNVRVIANDGKTELKLEKVGGRETIPIKINLDLLGKKGRIIEVPLDEEGKNTDLKLEATLNPGIYPDVSEGKYVGIVTLKIDYN